MYALQSSERERRAEEASREVLEWKKVIFMRDKVGNEYTGIVTGVAPFGLFVELDEIFVQGMVPVATIGGDFWRYHDREHRHARRVHQPRAPPRRSRSRSASSRSTKTATRSSSGCWKLRGTADQGAGAGR